MARRLSPAYRPRDPTQTVLYQVLDQHLAPFIAEVEAADRPLPGFVRRELEGLLRCGRLEWGFARQVCPACSFERLIGLPCRGRGVCPSCLGRRMIAGAARLVDFILPIAPVRQWVCTFHPRLRLAMAYNHDLCSRVIAIFVGEVMRWQRQIAKRELGLTSMSRAHGGAVTAIHRSGSSANLQVHVHSAVLDGVYVVGSPDSERHPEFHALPAPTPADLREIAGRVYANTKRKLCALGLDWEDDVELVALGAPLLTQEPLLLDCAEASVAGVGLLGDQAGRPLAPLVSGPVAVPADLAHLMDEHDACQHPGGFNLHAARRVQASDRAGLERLCRYLLHPPLAHDRLQWTGDGRVRLSFTRPWKNGVAAMTLTPLNLIARLVPLVPRPGTHQLRYHGVLAPYSKLRPYVTPRRPSGVVQLPMFNQRGQPTPRARHDQSSCPPEPEQQPNTPAQPPLAETSQAQGERTAVPPPPPQKLEPMSWAEAMHRMAAHNLEQCPRCGARLAPLTVVLDPDEIRRTLEDRGILDPIPPLSRAPARGPPHGQLTLPFASSSACDPASPFAA